MFFVFCKIYIKLQTIASLEYVVNIIKKSSAIIIYNFLIYSIIIKARIFLYRWLRRDCFGSDAQDEKSAL